MGSSGHRIPHETVPIALILLVTMELTGASDTWLHALCAALVIGRVIHYLGITKILPEYFRGIGMMATLGSVIVSSIWILTNSV